MYSSKFFSDKAYCKVDFKARNFGSHTISDQSLLLSTIVLNDTQTKIENFNSYGAREIMNYQ